MVTLSCCLGLGFRAVVGWSPGCCFSRVRACFGIWLHCLCFNSCAPLRLLCVSISASVLSSVCVACGDNVTFTKLYLSNMACRDSVTFTPLYPSNICIGRRRFAKINRLG